MKFKQFKVSFRSEIKAENKLIIEVKEMMESIYKNRMFSKLLTCQSSYLGQTLRLFSLKKTKRDLRAACHASD